MLYKWNNIACIPWGSAYFAQHNPWRSIQVIVCINNLFLLLLNNTPWYGWTICLLKDIWTISNMGLL